MRNNRKPCRTVNPGPAAGAAPLAPIRPLHHVASLVMGPKEEFSIPARDLDAAGKALRFVVRAAWIRGALEGTDVGAAGPDGELDVRVSKSGTDVVVRGTLKAELTVPCARCLEPARLAVSEDISALVVPAGVLGESSGDGDDDEIAPDQADMIPYDGETVVLDELVRDQLLLGLPMIPLCSEGCEGIRRPGSQEPAQAPTIDPRLQPLMRLKKPST
jgi:uncharacterized protein